MAKALPIIGIIAAVFAALATLVLVDAALFFVLPVLLAGSIILLAQRNLTGSIAGLVVLALAVIAALGLAGSITTKNGSSDFGISEAAGRVWAIVACLAVPMGAAAVRWADVLPQWVSYVGIGGAAVAILLAATNSGDLADQTNVMALLAGVLALAPIAPMVVLLRGEPSSPGSASN